MRSPESVTVIREYHTRIKPLAYNSGWSYTSARRNKNPQGFAAATFVLPWKCSQRPHGKLSRIAAAKEHGRRRENTREEAVVRTFRPPIPALAVLLARLLILHD
jgi:hypothetical protein